MAILVTAPHSASAANPPSGTREDWNE
jgi:hypothetical protein